MELSKEQENAVRAWVADGESIGGVRRRLKEEFGIVATFLDTRLYMIDKGISLAAQSAPEEKKEEPAKTDAAGAQAQPQDEAAGGVSVEADAVVPPGALAAGTARFSDGVTGRWYLDSYGRLGFESFSQDGYRPTQEDAAEFQTRLAELLRARGLM